MYHILTLFAPPVLAATDYGLYETAKTAELAQFGENLPGLIGNVLGTALSLVGVLFFALMLYGGITWMMAHGNAESEKKALSTITAAIIGILIVLGSYALTTFVLTSVQKSAPKQPPPAMTNEGCLKFTTKPTCVLPCKWETVTSPKVETCVLPQKE